MALVIEDKWVEGELRLRAARENTTPSQIVRRYLTGEGAPARMPFEGSSRRQPIDWDGLRRLSGAVAVGDSSQSKAEMDALYDEHGLPR